MERHGMRAYTLSCITLCVLCIKLTEQGYPEWSDTTDSTEPDSTANTFLSRLGINPSEKVTSPPVITRYVRNLYRMMETDVNTLRTSENYNPTVKIYQAISGSHWRNLHFNLSRSPPEGTISRIELAFTRHLQRNFNVRVWNPSESHGVVTQRTDDGNVADVTTLAMDQIYLPILRLRAEVQPRNHGLRHLTSILVVFENFNTNISEIRSRTKRYELFSNSTGNRTRVTAEALNLCRVKKWQVNFFQLHWYPTYIQAPEEFEANYCTGTCPPLPGESYFNTTNHAFVKSRYHVVTNYSDTTVSRACCVPVLYTDQSLLYRKNGVTVLSKIPQMKVLACGCR